MKTSLMSLPSLPRPIATAGMTACVLGVSSLFAGCVSVPTTSRVSTAPVASGAAAGGTSVGADSGLQTCPETVGTVRLQDGQASANTRGQAAGDPTVESLRRLFIDVDGMRQRNGNSGGDASIESLRLLIQQSNCLGIVERGLSESAADDEKGRAGSSGNELRDDANMGRGQEIAADFVLRSTVLSINSNESSSGFNVGGFFPKIAPGLSIGKSTSSADVQLVLFDVRTKMQLAVAQGRGSAENIKLATNVLGRFGRVLGGGQVGTQSNTSMAKILLQAYADAYNKLVPALARYKTQNVKGGLGAGGTLRVQGPSTADPSAVSK